MPAVNEFGQWLHDGDYRQHRISAGFHPFAHTESGDMVQGAEGLVALLGLASRGLFLGMRLLATTFGRGLVNVAECQISWHSKLVQSRPAPAHARYSSWKARY